MIKRILCLLLTFMLLFSMAACGHEHLFGEWSIVNEASCTNGGLKERVCECGEKETENIAATGHSYGEDQVVTEVSCTEDGKVTKTCTVCGVAEEETISALGHAFTAATAFTPKTCTNCGLTEGEALAKLVNIGDVVESEKHSFTIESAEFTGSLSEKRGYITYNHSSDYVYAIKLNFTNLATEAFEEWNSDRVTDVSMEYQGKYKYEGDYWCPVDDIVPLASETVYITYEVPESMGSDTSSSIVVTFTIDNKTYAMIVQEGDGAEQEAAQESAAQSNLESAITVGDVRSDGQNFSFEVKDIYYTSKPSEKNGNVTHSFGNGGYYLACKLSFTNLAPEAMESWGTERVSDMKLTLAGTYNYDGTVWIPGNDIVPLGTGSLYILFEVPESVESSTDPLEMIFKIDGTEFKIDCRSI